MGHAHRSHQQARRLNTGESDNSKNKDAYDHYKEAEDGSLYSSADKSLCIAPNDNDDIVVRPCTNYDRREWTAVIVEGTKSDKRTYKFITWQNDDNKCITVRDGVMEGAKLKMGPCRDKEDYLWKLDDGGKWRPKADLGLCIDLGNAQQGTKPALRECDDTKFQKWNFGKGQKESSDSKDSDDKTKDSDDGFKAGIVSPLLDDDLCVAADGDGISLEKCRDGKKNQSWYIVVVETSNGNYYDYPMVVSEANNDMCLDVTDAKQGRKIILAKCDEDDKHQRWDIEDGRRWRPMEDRSLCADIQLVREGTVIRLMDCSGTDRQRWNYSGGNGKDKKESDSSDSKDSDDSEQDCSDDESEEETIVLYGIGKTSKSSKGSKGSKASKGGYYYPSPTHYVKPRPKPPSCKPKPKPSPSSDSDDYWDHVKESSKGSIYSLADRSLCVAFNDDSDIVMRGCSNNSDRQWSLMTIAGDSDDDTTYKFITWKKDRDKCITVRGQVKEGSELRMAKCDNDEDFLWRFNEGNRWRPKADLGLCVDLDKVREGTRPTLEDCRDTGRQRWDVGKGDGSRPSSPSRPGPRPTPRPTPDPATCSADRTCGRPRRPI